ncbi:MAG: hypothetical protein KZQ83_03790 [gamma proteobacterium symbiont of Taylorina sp.]|nr:hypothetical protein [gamma proteobacterium symbiont of Taylorina sp.]
MNKSFYQQFRLLIGLLIIMIIIIFIKKYYLSHTDDSSIEIAAIDKNCNLHKDSCTTLLSNNRSITFSILPRNIPLLKPLKVQVQIHNINAQAIQIEITGINLDMGRFRTRLKDIGDSLFQGMSSLPVCSKKIMKWQAMVSVKTEQNIISAPFHFETTYTPTFIILE